VANTECQIALQSGDSFGPSPVRPEETINAIVRDRDGDDLTLCERGGIGADRQCTRGIDGANDCCDAIAIGVHADAEPLGCLDGVVTQRRVGQLRKRHVEVGFDVLRIVPWRFLKSNPGIALFR